MRVELLSVHVALGVSLPPEAVLSVLGAWRKHVRNHEYSNSQKRSLDEEYRFLGFLQPFYSMFAT